MLCALHVVLCASVDAAPHITGKKHEPFPAKVGKHLAERMKAKKLAPMMAPATAPSAYPATVDILFLRVEFKNETSVTDWSVCYSTAPPVQNGDPDPNTTGLGIWNSSAYAQPMGSNNYDYWINQAATRFPQYFTEVSYSQLTVNVIVSAVYTIANPMCYYGNETDADLSRLIVDAVNTANDIDFSLYDAVIVVHAGPGEETDIGVPASTGSGVPCDPDDPNSKLCTPNDLWSLYYSKSCFDRDPATQGCQPLPSLKNGAPFDEFIVMPQTDSQDGIIVDPLGVYTHEFGHWLGLPDLYDTDSVPDWDGVGKWSLMGDGIYNSGSDGILGSSPAHPDAWCKKYLKWVTPSEPAPFSNPGDPGATLLNPVETYKQIVKLPASTTTPSQYFLLENRQQTGFDYGLPGGGLMVWLIDDAVISANIDSNSVNNNPLGPGVKVIEADGDNELMTYGGADWGSPGDPFSNLPGTSMNTSFTPYTNPSSTPYIGSAWVYLKDISVDTSNNVGLTIGFAPTPPANPAVTHNSATELSWTANTETDIEKYNIYRNGAFLAEATTNQYTDETSTTGDTYSVTALDSNGHESARSEIVTITFAATGGGGGGGGGCFIATAAYGSYEAPYVKILREFRDGYLLSNSLGSYFVKFYYKVSPPIADFIRESEVLRAAVRLLLLPLIGFAAFLVKTSLTLKLMIFGIVVMGIKLRKAKIYHRDTETQSKAY